jgi:hypothetical protein
VLEVAYRARRAVLLEGPTGIGKSELVARVARKLGVAHRVLDLSLLEPPDLVGLPVIEDGRTRYAPPRALPSEGEGILMLEELNRAERYIQAPALQLLTARALHEYSLPAGWAVFAAINPESGDYQVSALDAALRARFLRLPVRADRGAWLAWAATAEVHPSIVAMVRAHERVFESVPPRSWTYASDMLRALSPAELADPTLVADALGGYLPGVWVDALLASGSLAARPLEIDAHACLERYDDEVARVVRGWKARGQTDRLEELVARLVAVLSGPEVSVLARGGALSLDAVEALCADLPGDLRERVQEALGGNATAASLLDVRAEDVLTGYGGSRAMERVSAWKADPLKHYRVALLVTAVRAELLAPARVIELRKSNAARLSLGQFLAQVGERWGLPLVDAMKRGGVTPIRPGA